jgi:hypothetical protein
LANNVKWFWCLKKLERLERLKIKK